MTSKSVLTARALLGDALCYRTVVNLSCLSVTLAYCGQTAGWIKVAFGREVDLGSGDIVLAPQVPKKGHSTPLLFSPCLLWSNGRPSQLLLSICILNHSSCGCT